MRGLEFEQWRTLRCLEFRLSGPTFMQGASGHYQPELKSVHPPGLK